MITIIDYKVGNLASIKNMFKKIGHRDVIITHDRNEILKADKLLLPGVGQFDFGMSQLIDSGLIPDIEFKVLEQKTPILGICLGAQLMTKSSEEGSQLGLGWFDAVTEKFKKNMMNESLKVPHMGWNEVERQNSSKLFNNFVDKPRFYFVHSYHMVCYEPEQIAALAEYGYPYVAAIEKENIVGVQFHPEKSHAFGMQLLRNFIENY